MKYSLVNQTQKRGSKNAIEIAVFVCSLNNDSGQLWNLRSGLHSKSLFKRFTARKYTAMVQRVGVGVIGCGAIANSAHLPSYFRLPGSKLVAVADLDEERARTAAQKYRAEAWYTDYHDLLGRSDIHATSICTPPDTHSEITVAAAESKKHILCEKPMALSVSQADAMIDAAETNKVLLMMSYPFRFDPSFIKVSELLRRGTIGKPFMAHAVFGNTGPSPTTRFFWDPERGGGAVLDIGVHVIDLLRWLVGEIKDVSSVTWRSRDGLAVEDNAIVSMTFDDGTLGTISVSWTYPHVVCKAEFVGTRGMILAGLSTDLKLSLEATKVGRKLGVITVLTRRKRHYLQEIGHFIECVRKGRKPAVNGVDGKRSLETALRGLARTG